MKSLSLSALALTSALSLLGCIAEDEGDDTTTEAPGESAAPAQDAPKLGEVEQQVAAFGYWGYGCSNDSWCYYDLGTLTNRTCFLAGVSGDYREGFVNVARVNGNWRLELRAGANKSVGARAVCISGATNSIGASWIGGQPAKQILGTVTSKRRCFLGGFSNLLTGSNGLDNTTDYLRTWKDSAGNWWLGGSIAGAATPYAYATCVDVPAAYNPYGIIGPASFNMVENVAGDVCGITKFGGPLIGGASDGVNIGYDGGTHFWSFTAQSGKFGEALCVR
jgi:hypothetical protein